MGKITRNELSPVLTAELDATVASISDTGEKLDTAITKIADNGSKLDAVKTSVTDNGSKLDAAALKQTEILTGVNGVKTDTTTIKADTATIKTNTQNILAQFPIRGGTDFSKLAFKSTVVRSSHYTYKVVEISGSGFFQYLSCFASSAYFSIQVDGGYIYDLEVFNTASLMIRFNSSLKVYVSVSTRTYVGYLLD